MSGLFQPLPRRDLGLNAPLVRALRRAAEELMAAQFAALSEIDSAASTTSVDTAAAERLDCSLGLARELIRCLARAVEEMDAGTVHRAFGAPGDFGYQTPIGDALARVYGVVVDAPTPDAAAVKGGAS